MNLAARLLAFENDPGLERVRFRQRLLWLLGLVLCVFVVFAIALRWHPLLLALAAAAAGWVIAESNALRTRIAQWAAFKRYIDWARVREDAYK